MPLLLACPLETHQRQHHGGVCLALSLRRAVVPPLPEFLALRVEVDASLQTDCTGVPGLSEELAWGWYVDGALERTRGWKNVLQVLHLEVAPFLQRTLFPSFVGRTSG